jgi:DNA mismatch repair protein MutS2
MNRESVNLLEYESLRALVGRWVASDMGRRQLADVTPSTERSALEQIHAETAEAMAYLAEASRPQTRAGEVPPRLRFEGLPDTAAGVARLHIQGAVLDPLELQALTTVLERAHEIRQALGAVRERFPRLGARGARLGDFRQAVREISGKILPDGTIADHASPTLARVRRDIERQRRLIQESLERFLRQHREDGLLQEEFVTIRNDRFVVPIIPGSRKKVPGVVHGSSGTGHTLFVEPLETIDLNNDLVRLTEEEAREVHSILRGMTEALRRHAHEVRETSDVLGELDLLFAKARFAEEFGCTVPRFSPDSAPRLRLKEARHPLLEDVLRRQQRSVVPVTLELDSQRPTLLISGPNTGGKTVSMKTVGLLALMAQSGLPVPAAEAELPVFADVLADIGDNQSIEQSLSSFSAHVARIREMVEAAAPGALVLLDELGRATDPEEGGALGVAILEEFRAHGALTLASTHLLALKVYGSNTAGVVNGSMGFNEQTLEPTYILRIGAPGKSAGLEIASRLGLPAALIEKARAAMSSTERDIARFLNELEARIGEAQTEAEALRRRKAELDERERELKHEMEKREAARLREIDQRAAEAMKRFEQESRATIERVLAAPEMRREAEKTLRQAARVKRELQESVRALPAKGESKPAAVAGDLKAGVRVRLHDVGQPGRVLRVLTNDMLEVEVGLLKMQVPVTEIVEVLPEAGPGGARLPQGVTFTPGPRWDTLTREINIIGKTADDAIEEVERFLDSAVLAEVTRVRIVHGHGMGVLRKAVQHLLARHPQVERHYPASPAEGGTGATIAELKSS